MKLLLTADWHINDYKNFNPYVGFRLQQFIKLAYDTVEIGKKNNCEVLVIAGDLIDIAVVKPTIQHVVKRVIDILKGGFKKIYYILGQHDIDTKGSTTTEDTIISLYDDEKFIYANHKELNIDGLRIGFQNWSTEQDTSWIEGKLDVLIGHYTKSNLFGQEIDDSKFDLMIHGDIHNSQVIGKFVSICNPIQKDMSSEASGSMIVYDTMLASWERIKVDEPHQKYLRIEYTRNPDEEGFASQILYKIFKPVEVNASGEQYEVPIPEWSEVTELINNCVERAQLSDIHNEVLAKSNSYQEIDFNFQLKYLDIQNYRSIDHLRLEFKGNDIILLLGENGSGKSSILYALGQFFYYDTHINDNASDFEEGLQVQLELGLYYQNKLFVIRKGAKWGLDIDGVPQGFPSKPQFENQLYNYLPFLSYSDVFFISSTESTLSGRYSPERRSELLSKFFKFDRVLSYSDTARELRDQTSIQFGEVEKEIQSKEGLLKFLKEKIDNLPNGTEEELEELRSEIDNLIKYQEDFRIYEIWRHKQSEIQTKLDTQRGNLEDLKDSFIAGDSLKEEQVSEMEKTVVTLSEKLEKLKSDYKELLNLRQNLITTKSQIDELNTQKASLDAEVCPTCGEPLKSDKHRELLKKYNERRIVIDENYKNLKVRYEKLIPKDENGIEDKMYYQFHIKETTNELQTLKKSLDDLKSIKAKKEQVEKQRNLIQNSINKLQAEMIEHISIKPKEVEYDSEAAVKIKTYSDKIKKLEEFLKVNKEYQEVQQTVEELKSQIEPIQERIDRLYNYQAMCSTVGDIYVEVLTRLAKSFSSENIRWYVESGTYRRKDYLIFQAQLRVKKKWRDYDSLSSGQKNLVDLDFLSKMLATRSGLLALDEILKHLDENNSVEAAELLSKLNVNTLLVATHSVSFPNYTQKLRLGLDEDGHTRVAED